MAEWLRFFRIGVINILGITVPGLLLIVFFSFGVLLPLAVAVIPFCQAFLSSDSDVCLARLDTLWVENRAMLFVLALVFAYIGGYIIRLSTPDVLDKISAKHVLDRMDKDAGVTGGQAAREDHWPTRLEELEKSAAGKEGSRREGDKFPYLHFKEYLASRGLKDLAEVVKWGPCDSKEDCKRSKTHVNAMKVEVLKRSSELSAVIESNEAHVRLMFGTWMAIMTCRNLVIVGVVASCFGLLAAAALPRYGIAFGHPPCAVCLLLGLSLLAIMHWARAGIENLFHYQRVRELTHIVACTYNARKLPNPPADAERAQT